MMMHHLRAVLSVGLLVSVSALAAATPADPPSVHPGTPGRALPEPVTPPRTLRLVILPDRTTGRDWGLKYLRLAVEDLNRLSPDAVISVGDMIQGYTRSVEQWKNERDEFASIVNGLTMPFYPLPGNHEVLSGTREPTDRTFENLYKDSFGPLYFSVDFDLATVICLYSDDNRFENGPEGIAAAQFDWLKGALTAARERAKPIFVVLHRPLWRARSSRWNETVHPLLVDAGVDAVIAGHFHSMQRDPDRDGVQYHLVAVCGGMIDQHPLTGQFQHLTFLQVRENGDFAIHHQPVGTTIPDDFILSADQDRVFRLKTMRRELSISGVLPDPSHADVMTTLTIELTNPADVPIRAELRLVDQPPGPTVWDDTMWLSRTQQDIFNAYVTEADSPIELTETFEPIEVAPGETIAKTITLACARQDAPIPPAEVWLRLSFTDSYERTVPVIVRRRVPIASEVHLASDTPSQSYPICAWYPSVYDTLEANPSARFRRTAEGELAIEVTVPDQVISAYGDDRPLPVRLRDPMSDAISLELRDDADTKMFFVEPFRSRQIWSVDERTGSTAAESIRLADLERLTGARWRATFVLPMPTGSIGVNIGVADNDETYHTQWRWLSPEGTPLRLHPGVTAGSR